MIYEYQFEMEQLDRWCNGVWSTLSL